MDAQSSKRIELDSVLQDERLNLNLHSLSLKDLREITNDFSDENLLGQGGFGTVYKGLLPNGNIIAVKKLITSTKPGLQDKQYENEVRHLMRLIHPNIVQLVGYCSETEKYPILHNGKYVYAEKSERLLFLEYMPKGSLRNHISDASSGLDWQTRYKIILGICHGLHYLHEEWQHSTPIIHRDLKPANILLDDNMVPKIADFGLSRLFGEEQTRTTTKNNVGTVGYMAPEYLNRGIITKELDIFSLGVIIIQVVTGKKQYPYNDDETSSQKFAEDVVKEWRNRPENLPGYTCQEFDFQQIRRCIDIGLLCVKDDRAQRPTTSRIIEMLASKDAECSNKRECELGSIKFKEGSSKARKGMFIIGTRVREDVGVRVQEAVMNPVVVQDRRNKLNGKSYPPKLDDRVYRLEEIARDGKYCKRLEKERILTVKDLLRILNKDSDKLAGILQMKKEHKTWEKMVKHASQCCLDGQQELTSYNCDERDVVLFFDCVHSLVGARFSGHYTARDKFDHDQQVLVDKLKVGAYVYLDLGLCPDHVMKDNIPVSIYKYTNTDSGAGQSFMSNAIQQNFPHHLAAHQVGGITAVKGLSNANANGDPGPSSSSLDHHGIHNYSDQGTQLDDHQELPALLSLNDLFQDSLNRLDTEGMGMTFLNDIGNNDDLQQAPTSAHSNMP